jgi:hypothetical protein
VSGNGRNAAFVPRLSVCQTLLLGDARLPPPSGTAVTLPHD